MKTEELKAQGLTDDQISYVMAANGKDINELKKTIGTAEAERDKWKEKAEKADEVLKQFDGVDVDGLNKEIAKYKKLAEDAEANFTKQLADRDFADSVSEAIRKHKGLNEKAIKALLDIDTLKASKNQREDIENAINALKGAEDSKMLFTAEEEPKAKPAVFTTSMAKSEAQKPKMTKSEILAIKDSGERRKAIMDNKELFPQLMTKE